MAFIIDDIINYFLGKNAQEQQAQLIDDQRTKLQGLKGPQFSDATYDPQMLKNIGDAQYQTVSIDPRTREAQMAGLGSLLQRANESADAQSDAARYKAIQQAGQVARQQNEGVMRDAQARGVGGSGLEFALRAQAGQDAANRAQDAGMTGAAQAALERLSAQSAYNQGLSTVRNQDTSLAGTNASIINDFNKYNNQQRWNQANFNTNAANQGAQYNLNRGDQNTLAKSNFDLSKYDRDAQLTGMQSQNIGAQAANGMNLTSGLASSAANIGMMIAGMPPMAGGGAGSSAGGTLANPGMTLLAAPPSANAGMSFFDQRRKQLGMG